MLSSLSTMEKVAAAVAACVLATLALAGILKLKLASSYADFIVGNVTWQAGTKFQDLVAGPVFILVLVSTFVLFAHQISRQKIQFGDENAIKISEQLLWWSLPSFAAISSLFLGTTIDVNIFVISAIGIAFITISSAYNSTKKVDVNPELLGSSALAVLLIAIVPLEIALVLGRAPMKIVGDISITPFLRASYLIIGLGMVVGLYYAMLHPEKLSRFLPKLFLLGQVGLPVLFLTLYPARLSLPTGELTKYETTVWLKLFVVGIVLWGILDVARRYQKHSRTTEWLKFLSPIALFAVLVALKAGGTIAPAISPDDYHFGESLLGWWSYLNGVIPYLEYVPAHGLIDDDLNRVMSSIFYDGTAGSVVEAGRLSFSVLAFLAFFSIYYFSGSIGLAFTSVFFLSGKLSWYFLTPFFCLWFSQSLRASPPKWLIVWIVSAPVVVLGVPPQGVLLVAATGVMAAYFAWLQLRNPEKKSWANIGSVLIIATLLALATPLGVMLFGAIRYVVENGPINQVAYGIAWERSWTIEAGAVFLTEAIRMSWVVIPILCLVIIWKERRDFQDPKSPLYAAIVIFLFVLLLVPYSMGRIGAGGVSRPGLIAIFGWAILLPIAAWRVTKPKNRVPLIFLVACMSALLNLGTISFSNFVRGISSKITTAPLRDGESVGLENIGRSYVEDDHWDRLIRLNALLKAKLSPEDPYLDLTSRNAQYFYLNRRPVMAVTAIYNMVSIAQQKRAVEELSENLPTLALLEGTNILHDGGGLALRTPYLYRFIVQNYTPRYEDGFIIGYKKVQALDERKPTLVVAVNNITDKKWDRGFHRTEAAIVLSDPVLSSYIKVGDRVRINNEEIRIIKRVWVEGNAVWLDGSPIAPPGTAIPKMIDVIVDSQVANEYRASLFQRSFSVSDFHRIPISWGRSENSLKNKMILRESIDGIPPSLHQLIVEDQGYIVTGVDPRLVYDISSLGISGHDAGLLRFDFNCVGMRAEPRIQVFWWGDDRQEPFKASSVSFTAESGSLIVPLDSSPFWLTLKKVKGLRIDLDNASACSEISVKNVKIYQRAS